MFTFSTGDKLILPLPVSNETIKLVFIVFVNISSSWAGELWNEHRNRNHTAANSLTILADRSSCAPITRYGIFLVVHVRYLCMKSDKLLTLHYSLHEMCSRLCCVVLVKKSNFSENAQLNILFLSRGSDWCNGVAFHHLACTITCLNVTTYDIVLFFKMAANWFRYFIIIQFLAKSRTTVTVM